MENMLKEMAKKLMEGNSYAKNSAYHQAMCALRDEEERLLEQLDKEEKEIYEAVVARRMDIGRMSDMEQFSYGFRMGALLMIDVYRQGGPLSRAAQ